MRQILTHFSIERRELIFKIYDINKHKICDNNKHIGLLNRSLFKIQPGLQ